jgi:cyclophilin family peptidyl-prolyl cis-trans isomerase
MLLAPVLAQLHEMHPDDLRVIFRHFPLTQIHDKASLAGQAAEAAGAQGAFWSMHDLLYDSYQEWIGLDPSEFTDWLVDMAGDLELDSTQFEADLRGGRYVDLMNDAFSEAVRIGIPGTPFVLINGQPFPIEPSLLNLEQGVRLAMLTTQRFSQYPPMTIDPDTEYFATLHLTIGEVVIQLLPQSAPKAVNSFVFLAREGWFDDNAIYRVQPGLYVETGDPSGLGYGDPGYHFDTELDPSLLFDAPGLVALNSSGPGTNGSRFFITLAPLPELNGTRTIFGRVVSGLELLESLQIRDPIEDLLIPAEAIVQFVEIEER